MLDKNEALKIKAGDRVWLGDIRKEQTSIHTIDRVTDTQFIIRPDPKSDQVWRFKRTGGTYRYTGSRVGGTFMSDYITALATPAECEKWDADQVEYKRHRAEAELQRRLYDAKRTELCELGGQGIHVTGESWGRSEERAGQWELTVHYLNEAQVRRVIEILKEAQIGLDFF